MFNHAMHNFGSFRMAEFSLSTDGAIHNYFADHFSPLLVLLSPLKYLFGSYTLLLIQLGSVIFGGIGVYKLSLNAELSTKVGAIILIHFFSLWGIYFALSFDFHLNVIAAMLVPWLVLTYRTKNTLQFLVFALLILLSKENIALWLPFIIIGLVLVEKKKIRDLWRLEIPLIIFTFLYAISVLVLIMPGLSESGINMQLERYSFMGESFGDKLNYFLNNPLDPFRLLLDQRLDPNAPAGMKLEFHLVMLLSGGLLILFRPLYIIMLIPIYAQKFLSMHPIIWGINMQYSIEVLPVISLVTIDVLANMKSNAWRLRLSILLALTALIVTISRIENQVIPWWDNTNVAFYKAEHYQPFVPRAEVKKLESLIPASSRICVSSSLSPRLSFRKEISLFPNVLNADYIALLEKDYYPLEQYDYYFSMDTLIYYGHYELVHRTENTFLYKRKGCINKDFKALPHPQMVWNLKIKKKVQTIRNDEKWLKDVEKKARTHNISIDSMLYLDAAYILKNPQ